VTPSTSPSASRIRSSAIHSTKNCVRALHVLLVQRVQHRVAGAVGRGAGALHRLLAVVGGVAAERALVDRAVGLRSNGMPKCSSSYTTFGASRHMNSIASWSPSQSLPLTVS
jgi:hypothetical protein